MADQRTRRKRKSPLSALMLVQCAVCALVLLIAGLVRLIGGDVYRDLRQTVYELLTDGGIADAVASMVDDA